MALSQFCYESVVRGHHISKDFWIPAEGEILSCVSSTNRFDSFAVAVKKDSVVVGHVPRKIAVIYSLFLRRRGTMPCQIVGARRYSSDVPQGAPMWCFTKVDLSPISDGNCFPSNTWQALICKSFNSSPCNKIF